MDVDVGLLEQRGHVVGQAHEVDPALQAQLSGELGEVRGLGPVARDAQARLAVTHLREGVQQVVDALLRDEVGDGEHERRGGLTRGPGAEAPGVDPVVDGAGAALVEAEARAVAVAHEVGDAGERVDPHHGEPVGRLAQQGAQRTGLRTKADRLAAGPVDEEHPRRPGRIGKQRDEAARGEHVEVEDVVAAQPGERLDRVELELVDLVPLHAHLAERARKLRVHGALAQHVEGVAAPARLSAELDEPALERAKLARREVHQQCDAHEGQATSRRPRAGLCQYLWG